MKLIEIAQAGVISDAPRISGVLLKAFNFLLSVFGTIAIICLVVSGILYLTAGGDQRRIETAKKSFLYAVTGIIIGLGCLIIIKTIGKIIGS